MRRRRPAHPNPFFVSRMTIFVMQGLAARQWQHILLQSIGEAEVTHDLFMDLLSTYRFNRLIEVFSP